MKKLLNVIKKIICVFGGIIFDPGYTDKYLYLETSWKRN